MYLALTGHETTVVEVEATIPVFEVDYISVCSPDASVRERRQKDKEDRLSLVVWRRPITTLHYFLLETLIKLKELTKK